MPSRKKCASGHGEGRHNTLDAANKPNSGLLLRALLDNAPVGLCCFDRALRYVFVNKTLADMNCLSVEDHIGLTMLEVLPRHAVEARKSLEQVFATGQPVRNIHLPGKTRNESSRTREWLASFYPVTDERGNVQWVCVYVWDASEAPKIIEDSRLADVFYQELLHHAPCLAFAKDMSGRYRFINRTCEVELGLQRQGVLGKTAHEIFTELVAEQISANDARVLASGNPQSFMEVLPTPRGPRDHLTTLFPLQDPRGEVKGLGGIAQDMGELRAKERELVIYRQIVSAAAIALALLGDDYTYLAANKAYLQFTGVPSADITGMRVDEVLGAELFHARLKRELDRCLAGESVQFETWLDLPSRGLRYVLASYTPCRNEAGDVIGVVVSARDDTERMQALEALRENDARIRSMFDNVPIGIFESTPEGKFLYVNPAVARMHHYDSPEQLMEVVNASSIAEVLYAEPGRRSRFVREACEASPEWSTFENKYLTKDGQVIDAQLTFSTTTDPVSGQQRLYGFALDITAQKKAEEALKESEESFRALFHDSVESQVLYDERGFVDCNASAALLLGFPDRGKLLGMHPADISPLRQPDGRDSAEKAREMLVKASLEEFHRFEWICRHRDGSDIHLDVSLRLFKRKGRNLFHATWRDITERKRLEEEQVRQAKDLRDMNAALRVILEQRERDREVLQEQTAHNLVHLVEPYLDRIVSAAHNPVVDRYIDIIRRNLEEAAAPLAKILDARHQSLTGNEIRVANLIRQGKTSKEISSLLNVSVHTVNYYRNSIRRKLGMKGGKINLRNQLDALAKK